MEENVVALTIKASPYGDNNLLIRILTAEGRALNALMRGVKKPAAKLKFAAQPFALCELNLHTKGKYTTVIGAKMIEDLFALTADYDAYSYAALFLEAVDVLCSEQYCPQAFILALKSLKDLLYSADSIKAVAQAFFEQLNKLAGIYKPAPLKAQINAFESEYNKSLLSLKAISAL